MSVPTNSSNRRFSVAMFLDERRLPIDQAITVASEVGVDYVWFINPHDGPNVAQMSDARADQIAKRIDDFGLKQLQISADIPFKQIDLIDIRSGSVAADHGFRRDLDDLERSMEIARRLGVDAVAAYTFAWPGEYTADKPTWPMHWLTRGGVISSDEMDKLVGAFSLVAERAEQSECKWSWP